MANQPPRQLTKPATDFDLQLAGAESDGGQTFDLKEKVVCGLWRSRLTVLVFLGLGSAGGLIAAAAAPNTYTSAARLRLRTGKVETFSIEELLGVEIERPTYFSPIDEVFLLQDPEIYRSVAAAIGPSEIIIPPDPTRHDTEATGLHLVLLHKIQKALFDATIGLHCSDSACPRCVQNAGEVLRARTELTPERASSVISLYHEAYSPELAQRIGQALIEACVERHQTEFAVSQYFGRSNEALDESYRSLVEAKQEYEAHRQKCGFVDIAAQRASLIAEQDAMKTDLRKDQAQRVGLQAQLKTLREQFAKTSPTVTQVIPPEVALNEEYTHWLKTRSELKIQKGSIQLDTGKAKDWVQQEEKRLDDRIRDTEEELAALEDEKIIITIPEQRLELPNEAYGRLNERIQDREAEEARLQALVGDLAASLERSETVFDQLLACEGTHQYWDLELANRQRAYSKLSEKNADLEALAPLDLQPEANLRELQAATLPLGKDGPRRSKLVSIGVLGGLAFGCGLALLRQFLDRRLRYPTTVERELGLPLLAVVPEVRALSGLPRRRHVA